MNTSTFDKLKNIDLKTHVSYFLNFNDPELSAKYQKFKVAQSNTYAFIPLHIAAVFFHMSSSYFGLRLRFDFVNLLNFVLSILWTIVLGNWLAIVHWKSLCFREGSSMWKFLTPTYIANLESAWIISDAVTLSCLLVCIASNGACDAKNNVSGRGCNYSGSANEVPMDMVMTMFFAPIIHAVILKGASFVSVLMAIGINGLTLFATLFAFNMSIGGPIIILFCPLCLLVMYEFQRQGISVFLLSQAQEVLLAEIDRLSTQTSKELRSMIGNVAHDLKTPMSAFVGGLDYISAMVAELEKLVGDRGGEITRGLKSIGESCTNMKNINQFMRMSINRCIDYTKATNGMVLVPHMETVNFREMLQLPLNCMGNLQNGKVSIELLPFSGEIATHVITDPQWFQENVLCLLSNAVKYSAEGVISITVSLTSEFPSDSRMSSSHHSFSGLTSPPTPDRSDKSLMILIEVEDNGIGVPDELKPHLFNPFKQAQRLAGGTGLGLFSLAKRMEAIGGKYGVENRKNGRMGSLFWFSVPYRPDASGDLNYHFPGPGIITSPNKPGSPRKGSPRLGSPRNSDGYLSTIAGNGSNGSNGHNGGITISTTTKFTPVDVIRADITERSGLHVLLVDDSMSILKMSERMLHHLGHKVTTAENGAVALKLMGSTFVNSKNSNPDLVQAPFDVVLMDLQMPIMDGLEATKRLRALEREAGGTHHQLIVGVSANSDHETTQAAFDAGVDEFIPKPFSIKTFETTYLKMVNKLEKRDEDWSRC